VWLLETGAGRGVTEEELARLYSEHGYLVLRRCMAYLGDVSRAQDALQEVFVRALRSADGFRGDASARTWLCRIADHLCIDLLRRERRSPFVALPAGEGAEAARDAELASALLSDDGDALRTARSLMNALDGQSQRLAVLCFIDELTQEEIAAELGLSRRTVGKRIKALRERARNLLDSEGTS
jgi:RNA polymerase sigma factor (sigma-70 family)